MLVSIGLDFRRAGLEIRERFHVEDADVPRIHDALASAGASEFVLARTCNRTETYCWWPNASADEVHDRLAREICQAWAGGDPVEAEVLLKNAHVRSSEDAVRHLFRVAAGLESQVLGDMHIQGQLRRAFREAIDDKRVGTHLHRLFETGLRVGKEVKRETELVTARSSVGAAAAVRAAAQWGSLEGRHCVVVGCGKSGTHAARALRELGATRLTLVNRTLARAEKLAAELGHAPAAGLDALPEVLGEAHVVIVATGAREPVITRALLEPARAAAGGRELIIVDVSVPRNVEEAAGALPGVDLVDLDTLNPEAAEVERSRRAAIPDAESIVEAGVAEYLSWLELRDARNSLRPLQEVISQVCRRELSHLAGESPSVHRTADRIVSRVMAHPMSVLRAASERGESVKETAGALRLLFADPGSLADAGSLEMGGAAISGRYARLDEQMNK